MKQSGQKSTKLSMTAFGARYGLRDLKQLCTPALRRRSLTELNTLLGIHSACPRHVDFVL